MAALAALAALAATAALAASLSIGCGIVPRSQMEFWRESAPEPPTQDKG